MVGIVNLVKHPFVNDGPYHCTIRNSTRLWLGRCFDLQIGAFQGESYRLVCFCDGDLSLGDIRVVLQGLRYGCFRFQKQVADACLFECLDSRAFSSFCFLEGGSISLGNLFVKKRFSPFLDRRHTYVDFMTLWNPLTRSPASPQLTTRLALPTEGLATPILVRQRECRTPSYNTPIDRT